MSKCKDPKLGNLLLAYELNGLDDDEKERFEVHLIECEHCFHELENFKREADLLAYDDDIKRLISRASVTGEKRTGSLLEKLRRLFWPDTPIIFKPALAYLLVLLMIIPAYQGLMKPSGDGIRSIQTITLLPDRSSEENVFQLSRQRDGLISFVFRGAIPGRSYQLSIETADGQVIYDNDNYDGFDEYETGRLFLPLADMNPGRYRLVITDPEDKPPWDRQEHSFQVVE